MAAGSLGRLTLDLAVRLSEFTDGLSRAERETRERTENMGESVRTFRDQMMEDLGGTQLGGAIDTLNSRLSSISGGGVMAGAALAGMAVGGVAVATGALITMALETSKADVQLQIMAATANTGLKSFQVLTHAAAGFGVEQEALAAILADTQEKLGEFSATGGGGAADFFEALQNNTKMTDEEIRNLGKTLQGKDGVEAIQLLKDNMDALGATSQEQRFVFESLAGDLGNLMPLFADGGRILEEYGVQLTDAGVIKTQAAIDESRKLAAQTQAVQTQMEGLKTQLVAQMIPALGTLTNYFTDGTNKGKGFRNEVNNVGGAIQTTAALVVGLAAGISIIAEAFMQVGAQMRNIGETSTAFFNADGLVAKGKVLAVGFTKTALIGADGYMSVTQKYEKAISTINRLMTGQQGKLSGLAATYYDANSFLQSHTSGLAINTVEAEENAKALEKQAAAAGKSAKKTATATTAISNQMMVYKAFRHAGLSDNQSRIITAEVGRENDYQSKYLWGGHNDPHNKKYNLGLISWQKERGEALYKYLKDLGLIQNNQIVKTQEALNAQAMFALKEMTTNSRFEKTKNQFLANADISYDEGTEVLGKNYIAWRYSDPKYASHHKRRDKHYNKLNADLGGTDVSKLFAAEKKAADDADKLLQDTLRRQGSIVAKYATEREKIESDHVANITEIESLYAEGSLDRIKYLAREQADYDEKRTAASRSILESYMAGEEKLTYEHNQKIEKINAEFIEGDPTRQLLIDLQDAAYQEDLANFRFAANAKAREQDKLYQSIANSIKANRSMAANDGMDRMAQRTMSEDDYAIWRLAQDHDESYNSANSQYSDRQSEITATDDRGDFLLPELERNKLLEIARQEHLDAMWAMEQDFALKEQNLDKQQAAQRVAIYQGLFAGLTGLTQAFAGEQSTAYRVMFAIEKGFAVAQSVIAIQQSIAKAMAIGFPANIPLIAQSVTQGAQIMSAIKNVQAPTVSGIAHGGLDYVPKESTYLLDQGERVLSPRQNKDLANFMAKGQQSSSGNIVINNNSSAEVTARRAPNGEVTIEMVDKMIEKSFRRIGQANSIESKSIQRGTTARVNRR